MTIPSDDELDAAVARIEPRLFMTLGARTRRRRLARMLGVTAAGAGVAAAGLVFGLALAPVIAVPVSSGAVPGASSPSPQPPLPQSSGGTIAGPAQRFVLLTRTISCYAADGSLTARLQLARSASTAEALCAGVMSPGTFGGQQKSLVTCAESNGALAVYSAATGTNSTKLCADHGASVASPNQ